MPPRKTKYRFAIGIFKLQEIIHPSYPMVMHDEPLICQDLLHSVGHTEKARQQCEWRGRRCRVQELAWLETCLPGWEGHQGLDLSKAGSTPSSMISAPDASIPALGVHASAVVSTAGSPAVCKGWVRPPRRSVSLQLAHQFSTAWALWWTKTLACFLWSISTFVGNSFGFYHYIR